MLLNCLTKWIRKKYVQTKIIQVYLLNRLHYSSDVLKSKTNINTLIVDHKVDAHNDLHPTCLDRCNLFPTTTFTQRALTDVTLSPQRALTDVTLSPQRLTPLDRCNPFPTTTYTQRALTDVTLSPKQQIGCRQIDILSGRYWIASSHNKPNENS